MHGNLLLPPPLPPPSPRRPLLTYQGFVDDYTNFMEDHASETVKIEEKFNLCKVIPLSRATPDYTAISNEDVTSFSALFYVRNRVHRLAPWLVINYEL